MSEQYNRHTTTLTGVAEALLHPIRGRYPLSQVRQVPFGGYSGKSLSTQTPVYSSSCLNKGAETVFFSFCFLFGLESDRGERNVASQGRAGMS